MKFKVGDKVKHEEFGLGEIKGINEDRTYAVEFEKENEFYFHTCNGLCENNHGYNIIENNLELVEVAKTTKYITIKEKTLKKYQDELKKWREDCVELAFDFEKLKGRVEAYEKMLEIREEK